MKKSQGFTLFELLVSISIIGILVALATVSYSAAQKKARDARRVQDMKSVQTAAEQYYSMNNYVYPASTTTPWEVDDQVVLEQFPTDPKPSDYTYEADFTSPGYCICAEMENITGGNSGPGCTFQAGVTHFCVKNQQ
jgi:prepilin-type N-terminal cleavage/methylation domain-containing protein